MPAANMLGLVNLMNQGLLPGQVMGNTTNPMVGSLLETANVMGLANMANPAGMMGLVNMLGAGNLASPGNVLLNNQLISAQGGSSFDSGLLPPGALLAPGQLAAPGIVQGGLGFSPMMSNKDGQQSGQGMMKQPPPASGGSMHVPAFPGGGGGQESRPARFSRGPADSEYAASGTTRRESDFGQAGSGTPEVWGTGRPPAGGLVKGQDSLGSQRDQTFERNWRSTGPSSSGATRHEASYGQYADSGESRKDDRRDERSRRPERDSRHEERSGRTDDRERGRHGREEQRDRKPYGDVRMERAGPAVRGGQDYGAGNDSFPGVSK